jgi:histidinol-phosphate phosphatase family protein
MKPIVTHDQAVILCGGLGVRLRPLTNSVPKPMVMVNSKPFLYHLLRQLSEQGITRFVLLTGYLGEKISDYFGDGSQYGWSVSYSQGPVEWDTGRRIWEARTRFDAQFLLLYSDNFVQFNFKKLKRLHKELGKPISLLLASKLKGNIKASAKGCIQAYDKTRNGEGFDYVEVGYMIVERDRILEDFTSYPDSPNFSFSAVLEKLAQQQKIAGLVVLDTYHSISDLERLALMSDYLSPKKILLIDRDGTINEKAPKGEYITSWDQFKWIPETRNAMRELANDGFKFIVITNQAGIARKMIDPEALEDIHQKMIADLKAFGVEVLKVYMCPDHWDDNSLMRKPAPGMFFQAAKEFSLRMDHCLYVGDDERDCRAAANASCGMVYLTSYDKSSKLEEFPNPFFISETLQDSVDHIRDTYHCWGEARI